MESLHLGQSSQSLPFSKLKSNMNESKTISQGIKNKIGMNWNNPDCIASSIMPKCCLNCGRCLSINNFLNGTAVSVPIQCGQLWRIMKVPFGKTVFAVTLLQGQTWMGDTDMQQGPRGMKTSVLVRLHLQYVHKLTHQLDNNNNKRSPGLCRAWNSWVVG